MFGSLAMVLGLSCIISGSLGICFIAHTCNIVPKDRSEQQFSESHSKAEKNGSEIIEVEYIEQPITFKNVNDNPALEKKYAELMVQNSLLEQKIKLKEEEDKKMQEEVKRTFKGNSKYSKLAEDILKG